MKLKPHIKIKELDEKTCFFFTEKIASGELEGEEFVISRTISSGLFIEINNRRFLIEGRDLLKQIVGEFFKKLRKEEEANG